MKELFSVVGHMVIPEHEGKRLQLVLAENRKDVWQQAGARPWGSSMRSLSLLIRPEWTESCPQLPSL